MTDKMYDEKGLRAARNENDPEKKAAREDEAADVEGHRLASFGPEKTREPGRMAARDEDDDDGEGEGVRSA
jgi:hypothetical protein